MSTTLNFKPLIHLPAWRANAQHLGAHVAGGCLAWDMRNNGDANPYIWSMRGAALLERYDAQTDEWMLMPSPAIAVGFAAGSWMVLHPSQGPRGTLAAGNTTTKVVLSTALPAAVGVNQLANSGAGLGYKIRIIGNAAGSSGKTEEKYIVANTGGTTPTIYLDSALTFTPATGDRYEILSGKLVICGSGALGAGINKTYDIATGAVTNVTQTNLPATIATDSCAVAMSELYVPNDKLPGQGYFGNITATASAATTITASGLPADLQADEYKFFQVRIVQDTVTPTAAGQRQKITTHTGGATGVFTVASWTVQPSSSAVFVVENNDDWVICKSSASTSTFTMSMSALTWDATTFGVNGGAGGAGNMLVHPFGVSRDTSNSFRHSKLLYFRGANTATIDELDISTGANGTWTNDIVYDGKGLITFTTGTCGAYSPYTPALNGRLFHINQNGTVRHLRFDVRNRRLDPETTLRFTVGAALVGQRMACLPFVDGATKMGIVYEWNPSSAYFFSLGIQF